jgi:ABC-2 type transport system permease protein
MWLFYYVLSVEMIFNHVPAIRGWTRGEAFLIVATLFIVESVRVIFFRDNLQEFPTSVTEGSLDVILSKPVDAQFWVSLRRVNFNGLSLFGGGVLFLFYAIRLVHIALSIKVIAVYILLVLCGALISYSLWFMLITCAFWYYRIDNISDLFSRVIDIGRYPSAVFGGILKVIFYTVIPLAVITNFPAEALRGTLTISALLYAFGLTALFLFLSRRFWLFAVSNYSSASS